VRLVSRHPALFLNLRQPASSQAGNAHLLFPSHSLGSLKEVHIKCGWNQSTFFSTFALSLSSFPLFVVQLSIFARRPSVSIISPRYQPNKLTLTPSCLYSGSIMTEVMTQQGHGLTAPSSRQDIVSALLNEYGNSFGYGDRSPSTFSPVPADKELPPPPPGSDGLKNKPLPAVERAEQRMSMKFKLRGKRIPQDIASRGCRVHYEHTLGAAQVVKRVFTRVHPCSSLHQHFDVAPPAHQTQLRSLSPTIPATALEPMHRVKCKDLLLTPVSH
jgi:hypothetical protein